MVSLPWQAVIAVLAAVLLVALLSHVRTRQRDAWLQGQDRLADAIGAQAMRENRFARAVSWAVTTQADSEACGDALEGPESRQDAGSTPIEENHRNGQNGQRFCA